jgi:hypothetical protein
MKHDEIKLAVWLALALVALAVLSWLAFGN